MEFQVYSEPNTSLEKESILDTLSQRYFRYCHIKDHIEFLIDTSLNEIENGVRSNRETQYRKQCKACREQRKPYSRKAAVEKRRKSDNIRLQLIDELSWEEVSRMISEGFVSI